VQAQAHLEQDSLLREAVALQGYEEERHSALLNALLVHYDIQIPQHAAPPLPQNIAWAFLRTEYGECFDSFFAFGLFAVAKDSGFFPAELVARFEPIMQEETRHIVFFINWMAYRQIQRGWVAQHLRAATSLRFYGRAMRRLVGTIRRGAEDNGQDFSATQASVFLDGFSTETFLESCLTENVRR
jgi:hypothetical protein